MPHRICPRDPCLHPFDSVGGFVMRSPDAVQTLIAVHPWPSGYITSSLGGHYTYRIIGPCCRLFDRETLPWPCCRLQWRGKEPSWRRIGRRFVPDISVKNAPSYCVEILEPGYSGETFVVTLYSDRLPPEHKQWWYGRYRSEADAG